MDVVEHSLPNDELLAEHFPVGEMIADELQARGWSQGDFARIIDRPEQFVSEILAGKRLLTRDSARQVAAAFGTSAELWLRLQDDYLLWEEGQNPEVKKQRWEIAQRAALYERVPMGVLQKQGYVCDSPVEQQLADVLSLFAAESLGECASKSSAAGKSSAAYHGKGDEGLAGDDGVGRAQQSWIACVRRSAQGLEAAAYDKQGLLSLVKSLSARLRSDGNMEHFQTLFAEVGTKLVYVESFPKAGIDSCALSDGGKPVIGLSGRGKRLDKVFFALLHEAAHILLGHVDGSETGVDDLRSGVCGVHGDRGVCGVHGDRGVGCELEMKANGLVDELLFCGKVSDVPRRVTKSWVEQEASRLLIPEIVLVGYLQKRGEIPRKSSLLRGAPTATEGLEEWIRPRPYRCN